MDLRPARRALRALFFVFAMTGLAGCGGPIAVDVPVVNEGVRSPEAEACSTVRSYPGGVAVAATALYEYRPTDLTRGLYGAPVSAGIPYAEVSVANAEGEVVQCGTTDASGAISLTVPSGAGAYTLRVFSRSDTAKLKISVIEDYYVNQPYSIAKSFTVLTGETSKAVGTLTASARASTSSRIEGGAFNILTQIFKVNEFLRAQLSDPSFVAPKVHVYWRAGYNPYEYFYRGSSSGLSFYLSGTGNLFILGGVGGDVMDSDTDHFDNSVIIHEYGHFLEDVYTRSDSRGGSHGIAGFVDPRLAWSEGWANFLQGAVLAGADPSWKYYIDTVGFSGDPAEYNNLADAGIVIKVDLTMSGAGGKCYATADNDTCGQVTRDGEGTFKEMSISRYLFKTIRAVVNGGAGIPFAALWTALTQEDSAGSPAGLGSSRLSFRNVALFNQFLASIIANDHPTLQSGWNTVRDDEKQNADRRDYADTLTRQTPGTCSPKTILPVADQTSPNQRSNPLRSNDFYEFDHDGNGGSIRLNYQNGISDASSYRDLDLYLYREDYDYVETWQPNNGSIVASSSRSPALDGGTETISLAGLPAGRYLINVKAYTYGKVNGLLTGTPAMTYVLQSVTTTTEDLCPAH